MLTRLIFAAYFLEADLILIVAPWSEFWMTTLAPYTASWVANAFVRGGVTGVGVITAFAGLVELAGVFGLGRPATGSSGPTRPE